MNYILCVDVGLANIGAVVVDLSRTILLTHPPQPAPDRIIEMAYHGTERSDQKQRWRYSDDKARRVQECARFYAGIIRKYDIKKCAAELPIGGAPNSQAATDLAYASSCLVTGLEIFNVAVEWYSPMEVKKAVTGRPGATKGQVMAEIERLYPEVLVQFPTIGRREHICDAIGVWLAARNGTLARL